jgi:hypothetical protein
VSGGNDFTFDEATHCYRKAGRSVPACTHILSSGGLVRFDFVNKDLLERSSDIGRETHRACHFYNQGKQFICDDAVRGYLNSWIVWCDKVGFRARISEHRQIASLNGMEYGMQIDAEGLVRNEETIVDLKTGQVYPHHAIQLAAYAAGLDHPKLETPMGRFRTRKRIVVQLQEDGKLAKIHRFDDKSDFDVFAATLFTTYWRMKNDKSYKGETP